MTRRATAAAARSRSPRPRRARDRWRRRKRAPASGSGPEQRGRAGRVGILVRADQEVVLDTARPAAGTMVGASRTRRSARRAMSLNACSSSLEPQLDTSATRRFARADQAPGGLDRRRPGRPACRSSIGCVARGRSKIFARSRPLLQIHGPFTAGFSSGVTRSIATLCARVQRVELPLRLAVPQVHRAAARAARTDRRRRFRYQTRDL